MESTQAEQATGRLTPAPDFAIPPCEDLRQCPWWRPLTVSVIGRPPRGDRVLAGFLPRLLERFRQHGHTVLESTDGDVDILLAFAQIPDGPEPLRQRIPERKVPLAIALMREFGLRRRPENLAVLVTIPERLSEWEHMDVVETTRMALARLGALMVVFLSGDRASGRLWEVTCGTLEGGHPTDKEHLPERLRDRLVTAACAREVSGGYEIVEDGLPRDLWERSRVPEALIEAGRRMDRLGLLPAPKRVADYASPRLARMYERFLGLKGYSEGMLFAFDPESGTMMVTASGRWDVDKRLLSRQDVVVIGGVRNGKLQVLAPEGVHPKGPSVEAGEMYALLQAVPHVRVRRTASGAWVPDPQGPVEVPIVRAGIHVHVGVQRIDEGLIESLPANRRLFPYGFGCGTDLMSQVAQDAARRSRAINDPQDPRAYVRWPMLYHGDTAVELWKPGIPQQPLEGLLDLYDPERLGAIEYTPHHIEQPA